MLKVLTFSVYIHCKVNVLHERTDDKQKEIYVLMNNETSCMFCF